MINITKNNSLKIPHRTTFRSLRDDDILFFKGLGFTHYEDGVTFNNVTYNGLKYHKEKFPFDFRIRICVDGRACVEGSRFGAKKLWDMVKTYFEITKE